MSEPQTGGRGPALGVVRLVALFAAVIALLALSRPTPLAVAVGTLFVAAGETLRIWAAGHLMKTVELATSGPYRHTRNPLYLGRLLILTGLVLAAWLPHGRSLAVLALGWVGFFGYYLPRKERIEPERLRRVHGEAYARYQREVPALLPRFTPWPGGVARGWSAERFLGNREHWMVLGLLATLGWLAARATGG